MVATMDFNKAPKYDKSKVYMWGGVHDGKMNIGPSMTREKMFPF